MAKRVQVYENRQPASDLQIWSPSALVILPDDRKFGQARSGWTATRFLDLNRFLEGCIVSATSYFPEEFLRIVAQQGVAPQAVLLERLSNYVDPRLPTDDSIAKLRNIHKHLATPRQTETIVKVTGSREFQILRDLGFVFGPVPDEFVWQ